MSRIDATFRSLKREGRTAFIPYVMAGDPSIERTEELVRTLEECGADIIELGVPWSDPVADGPVIQRAAERALAAGVNVRDVIGLVSKIRESTRIPIVLMTYYNPVFKYGEEAFCRDAASAGVDGVIVPDLPPEEGAAMMRQARAARLDTVFLAAPTSTPERRRLIARASRGFIYYVSITGITGARLELGPEQRACIEDLRAASGKPVALGFGVSTPEEAAAVATFADGVIVGSAIVRKAREPGLEEYLRGLRAAIG